MNWEGFIKYIGGTKFAAISFFVVAAIIIAYNTLIFFKGKAKAEDIVTKETKFNLLTRQKLRHLRNPILITIINIVLGIFLLLSISKVFITSPKIVTPKSTLADAITLTNEKPFTLVFDKPINTKKLEKALSPELPGRWEFKTTGFPFLSNSVIFVPEQTPAADTKYTVSLKNLRSLLGTSNSEYILTFATPKLPKIESIEPKDGADGILPKQEIIITTDSPHKDTAKFEFKFSPEIEFEVKTEGDKKYIIKAKDGFKKSTSYILESWMTPTTKNYASGKTIETGEKVVASKSSFRTLEAPGVSDYGPKGIGALTDSSIWIAFKQDMNKKETEKALSVSGNVTGTKSWEGNRKLILKPASLAKNTPYTVSLSNQAKTADDSLFEGNFSFTFTTIGHVLVSGFYPGNNSSNVGLSTAVSVTFNQAVDHASAQGKFSLSPTIPGSFSWSGNTMTYKHSGFGYYTRYTAAVGAGVKTIKGLDSIQSFSAAFTSKQYSKTLKVPTGRQKYSYSCMLAAGKQALAYKGVNVSEDTLLGLIGYDNNCFSGTWGGSNAVWGDPYVGYVGGLNGKEACDTGISWGYGAYWGPTAGAISNYRPTEIKTGWTVQGIAQEIENGNPVLVWWVNGRGSKVVSWKTPGGKSIYAVSNMHVQVVKGFTGSIANPTSFIVNDSGYGYPQTTFDVSSFKARWAWFGNSAVVVR